MRNLLTILAIFLGLAIMNAQTKEETIAWIKEKLEKYPVKDKNVVRAIDACQMIVEEYVIEQNVLEDEEILFQRYIIPTNPTKFSYGYLVFDGNVIETNYKGKLEYGNLVSIFRWSREEDLGNKMLKALQHLNTFCYKK